MKRIWQAVFTVFLMSGCAPAFATPTPSERFPPATQTRLTATSGATTSPWSEPSRISRASTSASSTPTTAPTIDPHPPVLAGTPLPIPAEPIRPANAGSVGELARWGNGLFHSALFSPDGKYLAAATSIGIYLYDASTFAQIRLIQTPEQADQLAFSPDGKILASSAYSGPIRLWDVDSGTLVQTPSGFRNGDAGIVFSPDGKYLAFRQYEEQRLILWDVAARTGRVFFALGEDWDPEKFWIMQIAFLPSGQAMAISLPDEILVVSVSGGEIVRTLKGDWGFEGIAASPDGKTLAVSIWEYSKENTIELWDITTATKISTLEGHEDRITGMVFSPDGKTLASGSDDSTVKVWDISTGEELRALAGYGGSVESVAFSPDGGKIVSVKTGDSGYELWDAASGRKLNPARARTGQTACIALSPDGKILAAVKLGGDIALNDASTGREIRLLSGHLSSVHHLEFSSDGARLASGGWDIPAIIWNVSNGRELLRLTISKSADDSTHAVAFSPDGGILAIGRQSGAIILWNTRTGEVVRTLTGHTSSVNDVAFSPDGKILASASYDWTVKLWDAAGGEEMRTLLASAGSVNSIAFSPDGKTLATGLADKIIRIWDVPSRALLRTLAGQTGYIYDVAFSPDGKILASGAADFTVTLWEADSGRKLRTLLGHLGSVIDVIFSPDGKLIYTNSWDGTIRVWGVAP
jgi:WD40 repeat protein